MFLGGKLLIFAKTQIFQFNQILPEFAKNFPKLAKTLPKFAQKIC